MGSESAATAVGAAGAGVDSLADLLDPRSVAAGCACSDAEEALRAAAALLERIDATDSRYVEEVIAREATYPTGLPTQPLGVALPHADRGVRRPAIALLTLAQPVTFGEMATSDGHVPVSLIILLALPSGDAHVRAVASLAELLQEPEFVGQAVRAPNAAALFAVFREWTSSER